MADTNNTRDSRHINGQLADCEPHVNHLLPGEWELLAECHRYQLYLANCGAELPVTELRSSLFEPGCGRAVTYCPDCLDDAAGVNADAGLVGSPPGTCLLTDGR